MELLGIALSVPVAFASSLAYCFFLRMAVMHRAAAARVLWTLSVAVLFAFAAEVSLLVSAGAAKSAAIFGPAFYRTHVSLFLLGTPALANVLVLGQPRGVVRWYWAVPICTLFAFVL